MKKTDNHTDYHLINEQAAAFIAAEPHYVAALALSRHRNVFLHIYVKRLNEGIQGEEL